MAEGYRERFWRNERGVAGEDRGGQQTRSSDDRGQPGLPQSVGGGSGLGRHWRLSKREGSL